MLHERHTTLMREMKSNINGACLTFLEMILNFFINYSWFIFYFSSRLRKIELIVYTRCLKRLVTLFL